MPGSVALALVKYTRMSDTEINGGQGGGDEWGEVLGGRVRDEGKSIIVVYWW